MSLSLGCREHFKGLMLFEEPPDVSVAPANGPSQASARVAAAARRSACATIDSTLCRGGTKLSDIGMPSCPTCPTVFFSLCAGNADRACL